MLRKSLCFAAAFSATVVLSDSPVLANDPNPALFPVQHERRWGYIDSAGKIRIPIQYDFADTFSEGVAAVEIGVEVGYIDSRGNYVLKPQFDSSGRFSESLACVRVNVAGKRKYGYIDKQGKLVIEGRFEHASDFRGGLAAVSIIAPSRAKRYGYIDKRGDIVILPLFKWAQPFCGGLAWVGDREDRVGCIASEGDYVVPFGVFTAARDFSQGMAAVCVGRWLLGIDGKWGYIDTEGNLLIETKFDLAHDFQEELAAVNLGGKYEMGGGLRFIGGKWGFIDKKGNIVLKAKWDWAGGFSEGLCDVLLDDSYGYIDRSGKLAIPPQFSEARPFRNGLARVRTGGSFKKEEKKDGYIDKTGQWVYSWTWNEEGTQKRNAPSPLSSQTPNVVTNQAQSVTNPPAKAAE